VSTYGWEIIFDILIIIAGLLLFAFLIGNMQVRAFYLIATQSVEFCEFDCIGDCCGKARMLGCIYGRSEGLGFRVERGV
jgi:hypothetical protein